MASIISCAIDGVPVKGAPGTSIVDAAGSVGIEIPRLCHDANLEPSGNCRLCVVEVEGSRALVGACHTPIAEGMSVNTRSGRVLEARQTIIELLLAGHTGSCVVDSEARECRLHNLASDLEAGPPRFRVRKPRHYETEEGRYVFRDMSRCIMCRRCVRVCKEVAGQDIYAVANRGFRSKVVVDCDVPLDKDVCRDCGLCIEYCPTSALLWPERVKRREGFSGAPEGKRTAESEDRTRLLNLLKERQRAEGRVSEAALSEIASSLTLPLSEVYGVATFYSFLSTRRLGRNVIRICKSLPCRMKHAPAIIEAIAKSIGIGPGETTKDGRFSFELTNCIGACDQAPAMLVNDTVYGNLTSGKIAEILGSME
jgi:predicted molibdopterin-dependent oxidoreductase YjgC